MDKGAWQAKSMGLQRGGHAEATEYARTTLIYQVELKNKEVKF